MSSNDFIFNLLLDNLEKINTAEILEVEGSIITITLKNIDEYIESRRYLRRKGFIFSEIMIEKIGCWIVSLFGHAVRHF